MKESLVFTKLKIPYEAIVEDNYILNPIIFLGKSVLQTLMYLLVSIFSKHIGEPTLKVNFFFWITPNF